MLGPAVLVLAVAIAFLLQQCGDGGDGGSDGTVATTTTLGGSTTNADARLPDDDGRRRRRGGAGAAATARRQGVPDRGDRGSSTTPPRTPCAQVEAQTNIPVDGTVGRVTWQQLAAPIRRGDRGEAVLGAEELLALLGADIAPDDQFTNGTQALVMDFQRDNGLAVDGIVDIDTWRVMLALADRPRRPATAPTTATT